MATFHTKFPLCSSSLVGLGCVPVIWLRNRGNYERTDWAKEEWARSVPATPAGKMAWSPFQNSKERVRRTLHKEQPNLHWINEFYFPVERRVTNRYRCFSFIWAEKMEISEWINLRENNRNLQGSLHEPYPDKILHTCTHGELQSVEMGRWSQGKRDSQTIQHREH